MVRAVDSQSLYLSQPISKDLVRYVKRATNEQNAAHIDAAPQLVGAPWATVGKE